MEWRVDSRVPLSVPDDIKNVEKLCPDIFAQRTNVAAADPAYLPIGKGIYE